MARFRATIQGQRGEASRLGNAKTGIAARINGWDAGILVEAEVTSDGHDAFVVYTTGGSHDRLRPHQVGRLTVDENGITAWEPA